jgi:hypothetical protein
MIKVSGYSDDVVEIDGATQWDDEIGAYDQDVIIYFRDGTILRMTYDGAWKAVVEKEGTAKHTIEKLIQNDDYYSDLFTIETDKIINVRKERAE